MAEYKLLVQETLIVLCLVLSSTLAATSVDSSTSNGSCITYERAALLSVKASLLDPNNYLSSWQGEDCCSWKGVRCSAKTGHVVKLNLRGMNSVKYGGEISYSLVNLQQLRYLDLSYNYFYGLQIPEFLGSMSSLRYLDISYTLLNGKIPPQLGNLTKLIYLDLKCWYFYNPGYNPFSVNLAWLSQLSSLKHLDMSFVNLTTAKDWTHEINMLPNLKELHLTHSKLRNTVPSLRQFNLTALKVLDISENYFNTTLAANWFWNATSVTLLDIRYCYFYGPISEEIGKMASLEKVSFLGNNLMSTMIPSSFKNLCNLKLLDLERSNTTGHITELMERLPNCPSNNLQMLDLSLNNIVGELPNQPGPLSNLTFLALYRNKITGKLPSWIWALRKLWVLDLRQNKINGVVNEDNLNSLANLELLGLGSTLIQIKIRPDWIPPFKLQYVLLESVQLGPEFPSWFRSQTSIMVLGIANTSITTIPHWFWVVISRAEFLDLRYNQISGTLPETLEFMAAKTLLLSNNRFSGMIPKFPRNITHIDISGNLFSGTLPSDLGAPQLKNLLLRNNSISGNIPSGLCSLQNLQVLDLSANMLTGEVPNCQEDSYPHMKHLLIVNLNTNNLSGEFPSVFKNGSYILFFDLSYNKFSGTLPVWIWDKMTYLAVLRLRFF